MFHSVGKTIGLLSAIKKPALLPKSNLTFLSRPVSAEIIQWNNATFKYRLYLPQVKRNLNSGIINFVYKIPHELQND